MTLRSFQVRTEFSSTTNSDLSGMVLGLLTSFFEGKEEGCLIFRKSQCASWDVVNGVTLLCDATCWLELT